MHIFDVLWMYVLVFIFSAIPFIEFGIIPVAAIAGLPLIPVTLIAYIGNTTTVLLVISLINQIIEWRQKRATNNQKTPSKRSERAKKIWQKYGLLGLALLGPIFVGTHIAAFMCVILGGTKIKTSYWMVISIGIWSILIAILTYYGVDFLGVETGKESFLNKYLQNAK